VLVERCCQGRGACDHCRPATNGTTARAAAAV
jgi:hypothetical protein